MKKAIFTTALLVVFSLFNLAVYAQGTVRGKVVDGSSLEPLPGANIVIKGTTTGTITSGSGQFSLDVSSNKGTLIISFVGYETKSVSYDLSRTSELGTVILESEALSMDDIVIVGSGVIDIARDRETPVAVSTIPVTEIVAKAGNQEFPEVMKNTPSVYVASQAGGFGDARVTIRGFQQENLALLFNGQPVNGMEDGRVYWSNWQGLSDIASAVQIQRGLGSSKLAISSVGATINIVTKATDKFESGRFQATYGNDNFMKGVLSYSTGLNEKGWGLSFLLSHWQGDGYNDGTQGQGQTYFFSVGYKPSEMHAFNFSVTGAPQWHNQNYSKNLSDYDRDGDGTITNEEQRYNNNWGYLNGDVYTWRKNFYHKPVANLNWDWNIDNNSSLSTVLYGSIGQGGGTGPYGSGRQAYIYNDNGQIDFDQIVANNKAIDSSGEDFHIPGRTIGKYGTAAIRRASMNMHRWLGAVINYNQDISDNLSLNLGTDFRTYYGQHFRQVDDLLGLDGFWDNNYRANGFQDIYPGGVVYTVEHGSSPYLFWENRNLEQEAKLDYYNTERISYAGVFGQLEYKNEIVSAFVQGALSTQTYQRFDYHSYSDPDEMKSDKLNHEGFNIKAGGNYNINDSHNVFINAGYYSRQPFFDDLFLNYLNDVNEDVGNEGVLGLEAGYGFRSDLIDVDVNAYYTAWSDRQIRESGDYDDDGSRDDVALFENVGQNHTGIEAEFKIKPTRAFDIGGFASVGNWVYAGNVEAFLYDEDRNPLNTENPILYLDDVKVGDAAQTSLGLIGKYRITRGLSVDADWRYYDNLYASIDPESFDSEDHQGSLELPSYGILDAGVSYKYFMRDNNSLVFRANFNNVLNKQYLSQSDTNIHAEEGDATWEGINMNNRVYFGNGFTWNFSVAYRF